MLASAEFIDYRANRSHSQYKLEQIDFDDFAYNLNKTIYNYQKSVAGNHIDKMSKFRRANSFKDILLHKKDYTIFQTFSRCAPGFDETDTKELMELILQLEYLLMLYKKFYPDQSNPILLASYLNCLTYNKEKYFDNYTSEISEMLQMSILRNSQQRIMDEKTDENLIKFLVNEINRRNKYKKNLQIIRSDMSQYQRLQEKYELLKKTKQLEHSNCNMLVASLKVLLKNNDNLSVTVRFPLVDKNKQLCLDLEKLLKQGDAHELLKLWNDYLDLSSSSAEIILLISMVQDLYQEDSWIIGQILDQAQEANISSIERIIIQIGSLKQFSPLSLNILNRSHKEIANLLQQKLRNLIPTFKINEELRIEKQIMIMQNSEEELQKEDDRHSLENCLFELKNIKMCLIPQGLLSQLFFIHRYCDDENESKGESDSPLKEEEIMPQQQHQQYQQQKQFLRQSSRRTSLISFGYSEMNAEYEHFEPLQQKITDMKLHSTIYIDSVDRKEWKHLIDKIKQLKHNLKESNDSHSNSSCSSFKTNYNEEKFIKQMKNFLQNQKMRR